MATATQLANQALIKLSAKMIVSIDSTDNANAMACNELLQPALNTFCTNFRWTWNENITLLDPVADPDPAPIDYDYEFLVPTDFLQLRDIKNDEDFRIIDYTILSGGRIRCNHDVVKLYYAASIAPDSLPSAYIDCFTSYFAHRLSPTVDGGKRADRLYAEYMQKAGGAFLEDAAQRKSPVDQEDYFNARSNHN